MTRPKNGTDDRLARLYDLMLDRALELAGTPAASGDQAAQDAGIERRTRALTAIVDRVLKLKAVLDAEQEANEPQEEPVVRIEYAYPDGTSHDAPPWANADYGGDGALPSHRLRKAFRKDRAGQVDDS
jgi:hypothetical protein